MFKLLSGLRILFDQIATSTKRFFEPPPSESQKPRAWSLELSKALAEHPQAHADRTASIQTPVIGGPEPIVAPAPAKDKRTLLRLAAALWDGRIFVSSSPLVGADGVQSWGCALNDAVFEGDSEAAENYRTSIERLGAAGTEMFFVSWVGPRLTGGTQAFQFEGRSFDISGYSDYNLAREQCEGQKLPRFGIFIQGGSSIPSSTEPQAPAATSPSREQQCLNQGLMLFFPSDEVAKAFSPIHPGGLWYWAEWRFSGLFAHLKLPQLATYDNPNQGAVHELTDAILCQNSTDAEKPLCVLVKQARAAGAWVGCLEWVGEENSVPLWFELNGIRVFVEDGESLCRNQAVRHVPSGTHIKLDSRRFVNESPVTATGEGAQQPATAQSEELPANAPELIRHQRALVIWDRDLYPDPEAPLSVCA